MMILDLEPVEADGVHLENGDAIKVSIINTQPDVSSVRLFYCQTPKGSRSLQTCEVHIFLLQMFLNCDILQKILHFSQ